jgi:hypothetical protein
MRIRRLFLDVDKAIKAPSLMEIAAAIEACNGVQACNITVGEIDLETVGTDITIEGDGMDYDEIAEAIEKTGAVVHGINQLIVGDRMVESVRRER